MPAHNNVLHLQMADGVVDDGHDVKIGVADQVGDVAVDKRVTGFEAGDLLGGNAGIGTSYPEVLRCLAGGEVGEEVGVGLLLLGGPGTVVLEHAVVGLAEVAADVLFGHGAPGGFVR